jgi:hypothetical protein
MKKAFTVIRVSAEDQLRGYGPDVQWFEDVLPSASNLGLEVSEELRSVIQEPATGWDREKFQQAIHEALRLYHEKKVEALIFPRVDRETRFLFGSFPLLSEIIRSGMEVCFARERLRLDPDDPESVERYLSKATQAQAYVETMRLNTMRGRKRRALQDHKMPTGGKKWAFDYDPTTGRYSKNESRASWVVKCYQWILEEGLSLRQCCLRLEKEGVLSPGSENWKRAMEKGRTWSKKPPRGDRWFATTLRNILLDPGNVGKFYAYCFQRVKCSDGKRRSKPVDTNSWLLVYEDPNMAIVTQEEYEALRQKMVRNKENSYRHAKRSYPPLRSLVFCTLCRRRMIGWTNVHSGIPYYVCPLCRNRINAQKLWEELRQEITARLLEPDRLLPGIKRQLESGQTLDKLEAEEKHLAEQLESLEEVRDRTRRLYLINKNYPIEKYLADDQRMVDQQQRISQELEMMRKQISELRQAVLDEDGIRYFCDQVANNLGELKESQWRLLLERMKAGIEVTPGESVRAKIALPSVSKPEEEIVYQTLG